jgi:hypothetical protein
VIYAIRNTRTNSVKIGYSGKPDGRLKGLQTGHEDDLVLEAYAQGDMQREAQLHAYLADERLRGEWFRGVKTESVTMLLTLTGKRGEADSEEQIHLARLVFRLCNEPQDRLDRFADLIRSETWSSLDDCADKIDAIFNWSRSL